MNKMLEDIVLTERVRYEQHMLVYTPENGGELIRIGGVMGAAVIIAWCAAMLASTLWWHILVEPAHIVLVLAFSLVLLKQSPRFMQWIKK